MAQMTSTEWTAESAYWRDNFMTRPYIKADEFRDFRFYEPAYRYGFESAHRYRGKSWDEAQRDLEHGWEDYKLRGKLMWHEIKDAVRDSWDRATGNR